MGDHALEVVCHPGRHKLSLCKAFGVVLYVGYIILSEGHNVGVMHVVEVKARWALLEHNGRAGRVDNYGPPLLDSELYVTL